MSKADKAKEDQWTEIKPPIEIEVEHTRSGQRRTLLADSKWRGQVRAKWGALAGDVEFQISTGQGRGQAHDWRLTLDSIRLLKGDPEYQPRPVKPAPLPRVRALKVDPRQVDWTQGQGGGR